MVRVIMHGCNGHMGQVISGLVANDPNAEIVAGNSALVHILYFLKKNGRVNHNAAADKAKRLGVEYSGGEQIEDKFSLVIYNCMTGVVAALISDNDVIIRA